MSAIYIHAGAVAGGVDELKSVLLQLMHPMKPEAPKQLQVSFNTVDGRNPAPKSSLSYPIIYKAFYIPCGAGCLPLTSINSIIDETVHAFGIKLCPRVPQEVSHVLGEIQAPRSL